MNIVSLCQFSCVLRLTWCKCFMDWMFVSNCRNILCAGWGAGSSRWRYIMVGRMMLSLCHLVQLRGIRVQLGRMRIWKECLWDILTFPQLFSQTWLLSRGFAWRIPRDWLREHKHLNTWHLQVWVKRVLMRLIGFVRRDGVSYHEWPFCTMEEKKF